MSDAVNIDWFAPPESVCRKHLDQLRTLAREIRPSADGYTFRSIVQKQFNDTSQLMREQAKGSNRPVVAHPSYLRSAVYGVTTTSNVLQGFAYKSRAAIFSFLESLHDN